MIEGRRITAFGIASMIAASPEAFVCPYSDAQPSSAPIAETCTRLCTPSSAAMRATRAAPSAWHAWNVLRPDSHRTPTQLTTASAPAITARVEASSRMLHCTGST